MKAYIISSAIAPDLFIRANKKAEALKKFAKKLGYNSCEELKGNLKDDMEEIDVTFLYEEAVIH